MRGCYGAPLKAAECLSIFLGHDAHSAGGVAAYCYEFLLIGRLGSLVVVLLFLSVRGMVVQKGHAK